MSLDKAIEHNKEHRGKYYGAKSIDPTCRNHGSCPWCQENRLHKDKKSKEKEKYDLEILNVEDLNNYGE